MFSNILIDFNQYISQILKNANISNFSVIKFLILIILSGIIFWLIGKVVRVLLKMFIRFVIMTKTDIDDILADNKVFKIFSHFLPILILKSSIASIFIDYKTFISIATEITDILLIVVLILFIQSILKSLNSILRKYNFFKTKPVESYTQLLNISNYFFGFLLILIEITGISLNTFFATMGAVSAIMIIAFKDSILGFISSIQVSANDILRINDWITFEKYGADGPVLEINLTTVKVQNFDKTYTTIPTYAFISDSFKNWRGMEESNGRRIKRTIHIKMSCIKFCDEKMLNKFKKFELIKDYIKKSEIIISKHNESNKIDKSELINGRNLTNIGVFREYMNKYVQKNININKKMTFMIRQLKCTPTGLPLELYCFSKRKEWVKYEHIMSDLFDHFLASIKYFDLEVFENPSGSDLKKLKL